MGTDKQLWKQHIDPNVKKIGYLPSFLNQFETLQLLNPTMLQETLVLEFKNTLILASSMTQALVSMEWISTWFLDVQGLMWPREKELRLMLVLLTRYQKMTLWSGSNRRYLLKPLHPNISLQVPHTILFKFPLVLTRRISLYDQELLDVAIIPFHLMTLMFGSGTILLGEIRCISLLGVQGQTLLLVKFWVEF